MWFEKAHEFELYCSVLGINLGGPQCLDIWPIMMIVSVRMLLEGICIQIGELCVDQIIHHNIFCCAQSTESPKTSTVRPPVK